MNLVQKKAPTFLLALEILGECRPDFWDGFTAFYKEQFCFSRCCHRIKDNIVALPNACFWEILSAEGTVNQSNGIYHKREDVSARVWINFNPLFSYCFLHLGAAKLQYFVHLLTFLAAIIAIAKLHPGWLYPHCIRRKR